MIDWRLIRGLGEEDAKTFLRLHEVFEAGDYTLSYDFDLDFGLLERGLVYEKTDAAYITEAGEDELARLEALALGSLDRASAAIDWDEGSRVHNWRNHVGERTRALWATFTDEQRAAIQEDAEEDAGREEWD